MLLFPNASLTSGSNAGVGDEYAFSHATAAGHHVIDGAALFAAAAPLPLEDDDGHSGQFADAPLPRPLDDDDDGSHGGHREHPALPPLATDHDPVAAAGLLAPLIKLEDDDDDDEDDGGADDDDDDDDGEAFAAALDAGMDPEQAALDAGEEAAAAAMEAAAAAEAAEACLGNVLDDVGVVDVRHTDLAEDDRHAFAAAHPSPHRHRQEPAGDARAAPGPPDDDVVFAAAAAAAAVQAADGMAVVVDQALLATAAAAAASQVSQVLADAEPPVPQDVARPYAPPHLPDGAEPHDYPGELGPLSPQEHGELLQQRRDNDRKRYSAMTPEARASYNKHRRDLYHKQGETARKRRRERERGRYHALQGDDKRQRNERRAKLERDRYNRLSKDALETRNSKRRDRAKQRKGAPEEQGDPSADYPGDLGLVATIPPPAGPAGDPGDGDAYLSHLRDAHPGDEVLGAPLPEATVDVGDNSHAHALAHHAMADMSALAAEVAEQVIAGTHLEGAMHSVARAHTTSVQETLEDDGPSVQI